MANHREGIGDYAKKVLRTTQRQRKGHKDIEKEHKDIEKEHKGIFTTGVCTTGVCTTGVCTFCTKKKKNIFQHTNTFVHFNTNTLTQTH